MKLKYPYTQIASMKAINKAVKELRLLKSQYPYLKKHVQVYVHKEGKSYGVYLLTSITAGIWHEEPEHKMVEPAVWQEVQAKFRAIIEELIPTISPDEFIPYKNERQWNRKTYFIEEYIGIREYIMYKELADNV